MRSEKSNAETYFCVDYSFAYFGRVFCFLHAFVRGGLLLLLDHGCAKRARNNLGSKMNLNTLKKTLVWLCIIAITLIFGVILIPLALITLMLNFFVAELEIPKHTGWNGHL